MDAGIGTVFSVSVGAVSSSLLELARTMLSNSASSSSESPVLIA
jgi:hypothetical protein